MIGAAGAWADEPQGSDQLLVADGGGPAYQSNVAPPPPPSTSPGAAQDGNGTSKPNGNPPGPAAPEGEKSAKDKEKEQGKEGEKPDKKDKEKKEGEDKEKKEEEKKDEDACKLWSFHAQTTAVAQGDPGFPALYSGPNSLNAAGERQESLSADLFIGRRLWEGAEMHVDALMWQGFGLTQTFGVEAFPNGDAYKAGTTIPDFMVARLFIRQTFGLGGEQEDVPDDPLTLAGKQDISRLTFTVGRLSPTDICDNNTYAKDPHTQFLNWAMMCQPRVGLRAGYRRIHHGTCHGIESAGLGLALRIVPDARYEEWFHRRRPDFHVARRR